MKVQTEPAPHRRWRVHVAAVIALACASVAGFAIAVFALVNLYPMCEADYSEDTVTAVKSYQGQLFCSVKEHDIVDRKVAPAALLASPVLAGLTGFIVWCKRRRFKSLAIFAAASLAFPALIWISVAVVPADCTEGQWDKYGARGCERNEELRTGLAYY